MLVLLYYTYVGAHMCASYEVTKHTPVDEDHLCVFVGGTCCWRIVLAHVAKHVHGLHIQLIVADFFVRAELCLEDTIANTKGQRKKAGTKSEVAHKWARWLHNLCCLGLPLCFRAGNKSRSGPQVGLVAT